MNTFRLIVLVAFALVFGSQPAKSSDFEWSSVIQLRGEGRGYPNNYYGGSFVQRADGKMLVTYRSANNVMLSYVDTEEEFLTVENVSARNEWVFRTLYSSGDSSLAYNDSRLQRLQDGRILLYILEHGDNEDRERPFRVDVYESKNGLGTDFALKSTIVNQYLFYFAFGARSMGEAIEVKGRILLPLTALRRTGTDPDRQDSYLYCAMSRDGGRTWILDQITPYSTWRDPSRGFGIAGNRVIVLDQIYYGGGETKLRSKPLSQIGMSLGDGTREWAASETYQQKVLTDMLSSHFFYAPDGYTYFQYNPGSQLYSMYRRPSRSPIEVSPSAGQKPYEMGPRASGATWIGPINPEGLGDDASESLRMTPSGHLVLVGSSGYGGGSTSHMFVGFRKR